MPSQSGRREGSSPTGRWSFTTDLAGGETGDQDYALLGRLEHAAVAGGERRGELPGGHQQREIARDDLPDHAERRFDRQRQGVGVGLGGGALLVPDAAGEVAEVVDRGLVVELGAFGAGGGLHRGVQGAEVGVTAKVREFVTLA